MADNKVILFNIKVDGKELDLTKTSINEFNKVVSDAQSKLKDLKLGSSDWKQLNNEIKNAETAFQQTKDTLNETDGKFKSLRLQIRQATVQFQELEEKGDLEGMKKAKKRLDDLGDQLEITQLKAMEFHDALATMPGIAGTVGQSLQGLDKAFKVLVANPFLATVTALVGAFSFLKEALSKTKEGQGALNKVSQAFSSIMGPLLALINTVAVPIFEKLALIISKVGEAFSWFAEKLGVSKASIAAATKDIDEVGKEAAENEKKRQEEAKARAEKEAQRKKEAKEKAIKDAEDEKKRQQDLIKSNEDLEQSTTELLRSKIAASKDPIQALKDEQAQKDEDFAREKARIEKLKKVKGTTVEEQKQLTIDLNNLEAAYNKDKQTRDEKKIEEGKKVQKQLMDDEIGALNLKKAKGELTEKEYQEQLFNIQKKYITDKKELNDIEVANEQVKANQKKAIAEQERADKLTKLQNEMNIIDKANAASIYDDEEDAKRFEEKRLKMAEAEKIELAAKDLNESERNKIIQKYSDARNALGLQEVENTRKNEQERLKVKQQALDGIISIVGAESEVGRAALIAKQVLLAKELVMEISRTITFSTQAAARSTVAVAEGTAQTAKIGFPQNIPMLIGYAVQAAAIISAIVSAVKSAKSSATSANVDTGGPPPPAPAQPAGYASGGMIDGPRHAQGGTLIEAEGGEAVMTRGAVSMFRPLLSQLNQMGGGTSFNRSMVSRFDSPKSAYPADFTQQPTQIIKSYVVEGELTSAQQKQARLKELSTI
jgi:hypothetical protein